MSTPSNQTLKTKKPVCKYCREGHRPKVLSDGSVEHWIVKIIFPARINIIACREPEAFRAEAIAP